MRSNRGQHGQILVLFTLALVAMLAMLGLLFDGGKALTLRRQLQDAGDAASLAAVNTMQALTPRTCSAIAGPPPGAPQAAIVTAARAAARVSIPGLSDAQITVTCASGWDNYAVQVDLAAPSDTYFGRVVGMGGIRVGTTSQAVNGVFSGPLYSIIVLDGSNPSWNSLGEATRRGCPSVLISGGPTVTLEGSLAIDSACGAGNNGALGTNGNSATLNLVTPAKINIVGDYVPSALTISPAPLVHQRKVRDPLDTLPAVPSLTTVSNSRLVLSGSSTVLNPGVYVGGIQMKNSAKAFLRPGIYVMKGGGFDIGAQNAVYSVPAGVSTTTDATWSADCPQATCGVLLYNSAGSGSTAMGPISIGAGATLKLRPYKAAADANTATKKIEFENLLVWQDASPAPGPSAAQPAIALSGGGTVDIGGTIYAPSALVQMGGGSGGSGGATDVTLQFIVWDLTLSGNSSFVFRYRDGSFAKPLDYGLIK